MISRKGSLVFKENDALNQQWRDRLQMIMTVIKLPVFRFFLHNGYVTEFVDGTDLHGENLTDKLPEEIRLNFLQRKAVIKLFRDIVYAGIETGYTLADFTKKNIMIDGNKAYLVDFEVIVKGELSQDYIKIFQEMLDYLNINYKFDGDLKRLYENLN